jgi:hypothetical protein
MSEIPLEIFYKHEVVSINPKKVEHEENEDDLSRKYP